jgi:hypothetical protein
MVHPREYDETPEGRICAEAREIIIWMFQEQKKMNPFLDYPPVPDYRDFYDHLSPVIRVEMLRVQGQALDSTKLREAERDLARERANREKQTPRGERRK